MDKFFNFQLEPELLPFVPRFVVDNQWMIGFICSIVIPLMGLVFCIIINQYYQNKLINCDPDNLTLKRAYKKNDRTVSMCVFISWIILCVNVFSNVVLPDISKPVGLIIMVCFIILPLTDVYTTHRSIGTNYQREANPLGRYIMIKWGKRGSYIQVISVWILLCVVFYFLINYNPLRFILTILGMYIGLFILNYRTTKLFKKYPNLYWNTEWYDGKKVT